MAGKLEQGQIDGILSALGPANQAFQRVYPGEPSARQPLHTVYGGAQLYKAETTQKLGEIGLRLLKEYAPDATSLAQALELPGWKEGNEVGSEGQRLAEVVYERVVAKLEREPVEDFRIDFEDGFGNRPDAEEDAEAERTAKEVARGLEEGVLPPFLGIRVKCFSEELKGRSARTLDIFVSTLSEETGGVIPDGFIITLPKVTIPAQVEACESLLSLLEEANGLSRGVLKMELMIEVTQSIFSADGRSTLPLLLQATNGRCTGAHFGTYDYTASCNITAEHQVMDHPACDFAKEMMKNAYAGTGIFLSDGATNVMPVAPHRGADLTDGQRSENIQVVHAAWKQGYDHIVHSLTNGFYQGWDLHPGQIPIRYAACFAFFLQSLDEASERLSNFVEKSAQATLVGDIFDDAATGQGLLNFFLRALNSGAITIEQVTATGLTLEEIQGRSFLRILENRRQG